MVGVENISL